MSGISYNQENLIKSILADDSNREKSGASAPLWCAWKTRLKQGKLSDEKQQGILTAMGYQIKTKRTWAKSK